MRCRAPGALQAGAAHPERKVLRRADRFMGATVTRNDFRHEADSAATRRN
jgi:hypothetical protein